MFTIVLSLASSLVRLLQFLLLARAVMSWFATAGGSKLYDLIYQLTEPMIMPFRSLLSRVEAVRMFPLDIAYLCTILALEVIRMTLYRI